MSPKIIPVTEFRGRVLETVRRAQKTGQEYVVTARGKPAAVLMGFDEWEALVETREIKRDRGLMTELRHSQRYFARGGKGKSHRLLEWS